MKVILSILIFSNSFCIGQCDTSTLYWESGLIKAKGCMEKGSKEGRWVYFQNYILSPIDSIGSFLKGKKMGLWKFYVPGAEKLIVSQGEFIDDKKVGYWKEDGFEGEYLNGLKEGCWIGYSAIDSLHVDEINYKNGRMEGISKGYYPNGNLRFSAFYRNGLFDGEFIKFSSGGKLMEKGRYKKGHMEGEWYTSDAAGLPISKGMYKKGIKQGTWLYYSEQGNLVKEEVYNKRGGVVKVLNFNN